MSPCAGCKTISMSCTKNIPVYYLFVARTFYIHAQNHPPNPPEWFHRWNRCCGKVLAATMRCMHVTAKKKPTLENLMQENRNNEPASSKEHTHTHTHTHSTMTTLSLPRFTMDLTCQRCKFSSSSNFNLAFSSSGPEWGRASAQAAWWNKKAYEGRGGRDVRSWGCPW